MLKICNQCDVCSTAYEGISKLRKHETHHSNIQVINNNNVISVVYLLSIKSNIKVMRRHVIIQMFLEQTHIVIDGIMS